MDYVIIKTGFSSIRHNIIFQKQTQPKGENLVKAGHVRDVTEYRKESTSYLIKANVIRQVSVGETPYIVQLYIDAERMVTGVSCTCVYNKSGKCKHVAALIFYINNHESLSKTSFEQQWGNPTTRQFVQEKYSKGSSFEVMFPPPKKPYVEPPPIDMSKLVNSCPLKNILLVDEHSHEESMKRVLAKRQMEVEEIHENCAKFVKIMLQLCEIHNIYKAHIVIDQNLKMFYEKNIVLGSSEALIKLCCDTLLQSKCDTWFSARRLRISASTNVHSIKSRKTNSIEALVEEMLYPKKVETPATVYGQKNESIARKHYEDLYNVKVQQFGLVVSADQPWLCASPDGVVIRDEFIEKILEIKCPSSCVKLSIVDYEAEKCNVSYLKVNSDNSVTLNEMTKYFTQCQVQMYVTGTDTCDLFVYSPVENGSCCVTVRRDEKFLMDVIPKCEKFYFEQYLPTLYNKMLVECQQLSQTSNEKQKSSKRSFTGLNVVNIM